MSSSDGGNYRTTERHDLRIPETGSSNWDQPWAWVVEVLDERLLHTGPAADLDTVEPTNNTVYLATDTGEMWYGSGGSLDSDASWTPIPSSGGMEQHGNEYHSTDFAAQADLDTATSSTYITTGDETTTLPNSTTHATLSGDDLHAPAQHGEEAHSTDFATQTELDSVSSASLITTADESTSLANSTTHASLTGTDLHDPAAHGDESHTTEYLTDASLNYVSVVEHGAVGDGSTDDTQAILDAITAAQADDKPVYLPTGTYSITSSIDIGDRRLFGDGMGKSILDVGADLSSGVVVSGQGGEAIGFTVNCNARTHVGVRLTGSETLAKRVESDNPSQYGTTTDTTACIAAFSAPDANIVECRATRARAPNSGVSRGILVDGSSGGRVLVTDCLVDDVTPSDDGDGIVVQSGNERSRVVDNTIVNASKSAVKVNTGGEYTTVSSNTCHTVAGGLSVIRAQATGTNINGNTISQPEVGGELIRVSDGAENVTISSNILEITNATGDCECIRVRGTETNVAIQGNTLDMNSTGRHGIQVDASTSVTIANNTLSDLGSRAINLEGPTLCSVTGNTINGTGAHGIFVGSGSKITITGNSITSNFEAISDTNTIATVGTNAT